MLASVQPRRWVPAAIAEGLGLPARVAPQTYDRYAHLGGAGAVANLIAARDAGLLRGARSSSCTPRAQASPERQRAPLVGSDVTSVVQRLKAARSW